MFDELKKALLVGVGGTAIAVEKSIEQVDRLVDKGKLTVAEGKKLTEELIQKNQNKATSDREALEALLLEMNVAQRKDIEDLEAKVEELQKKIENKPENK
jgi:polyhydroxyalkanoate synthesis regulator phasin